MRHLSQIFLWRCSSFHRLLKCPWRCWTNNVSFSFWHHLNCSCLAGEWCEVLWRKCRWDGKPQRKIFYKESGRKCDCEKGGRRQKANLRSLILRNNSVLQHLLFSVHVKSLCLWLSTTFSLYTQSPLGRKRFIRVLYSTPKNSLSST